jgi:hypothetical protein
MKNEKTSESNLQNFVQLEAKIYIYLTYITYQLCYEVAGLKRFFSCPSVFRKQKHDDGYHLVSIN